MITRPKILLFLALSVCPGAALSQPPPSISLQARAIASGGKVRSTVVSTNVVTPGFGYDRTLFAQDFWRARERESQLGLEIDLRNFRKDPQPVQVLALFFAKTFTTRTVYLLSAEQAVFDLRGSDSTRSRMYSGVARNHTSRSYIQGVNPDPYGYYPFVWYASDTTDGSKMHGWIVLAMVNGRVVQARSSNPTLENLARDEFALAEMLKPLETARKPRPPE